MKRGTVREDGKVFARILYGKEIWLTKEQYEKREKSRKEYVRKCMKMYYSRRKSVRKIGEYDHQKNLYFCGISSSGKEVWKKKCFYERIVAAAKKGKKNYIDKCKKMPPTDLKVGNINPNNPKEYVIFKIGNKVFFGSKEKLEKRKEQLRIVYLKRSIKAKKIRDEILKDKIDKKRRGDKRIEDNKIFWHYSKVGKEIWLDPEIFFERRNKDIARRKEYRNKVREKKKQSQAYNHNISSENHYNIFQSNETQDFF